MYERADEMGLGKTVQSIAVLCQLAEAKGIWGPFIVVGPASTLHNWQKELAKFAPVRQVEYVVFNHLLDVFGDS